MIPNITNGSSFLGAGMYFLHDKRTEQQKDAQEALLTDERVEWTHTLNCTFDDPWKALHEMRSTAENEKELRQAAGLKPGYRTKECVKDISLSWDPSENPTKEEMIEATQSFLKDMGWSEHQAVLVSHNDTDHNHVHIILNKIHPDNGGRLDEKLDQPRSQEWAHRYDEERGNTFCKERAAKYDRGEEIQPCGVPHQDWQSWKDLSKGFNSQLRVQKEIDAHEWDILKQLQRDERDAFREESKKAERDARKAVYDEVRDAFRPDWREFYELRDKSTAEDRQQVEACRQELLRAQQAATLQAQTEAIQQLREDRGAAYEEMLKRHREEKADLAHDQEADITRYDILAQAYPNRMADTRDERADALSRVQTDDLLGHAGPQDRGGEGIEGRSAENQLAHEIGDGPPEPAGERAPRRDALEGLAFGGLGVIGALGESLTGVTPPEPRDLFARMREQREEVEAARAERMEARRQEREHAREEEERERDRDDWTERRRERDR